MEQYEGDEVKKGRPKWMLWAVIGVVAIVVIVVMATQLGGGPSSTSGLTIDDLSAIVTQQSTSIQGLSQWKATATEDLANFNTKQQQILSQLSGITNPKDWTSDMSELRADVTALEDAMAGINTTVPRYAMVSGMEEKLTGIYIDVSVYGAGDYPVIVSLYGNNLQNDTISFKPNSGCSIQEIYSYSDYNLSSSVTQMAIVVAPSESWDVVGLIQLKAVGNATVSYAMATVGDSWAKAEEEW